MVRIWNVVLSDVFPYFFVFIAINLSFLKDMWCLHVCTAQTRGSAANSNCQLGCERPFCAAPRDITHLWDELQRFPGMDSKTEDGWGLCADEVMRGWKAGVLHLWLSRRGPGDVLRPQHTNTVTNKSKHKVGERADTTAILTVKLVVLLSIKYTASRV